MAVDEPDSCHPPLKQTSLAVSESSKCRTDQYNCTKNTVPHLYSDPRLLCCLHSFCKQCLNDRVIANGAIACPTCGESSTLPNNELLGIDSLPVNVRLLHETEAANIIEKAKSNSVVCEECITNPPAVSYCIDCEQFICSDCSDSHKRKRKLLDHKLIAIDELSISSIVAKPKPLLCTTHDWEPMNLYCKECNTTKCRICFLTEHSTHTSISIEEVAESNKEELQKHLLPLKDIIARAEASLQANTAAQLQLKENTQKVVDGVEAVFKELHDALKKRKEEILKDVITVSNNKHSQLQKERNETEKELQSVISSVQIIESTLATYTPEELVPANETFKSYLDKKAKGYTGSKKQVKVDIKISFKKDMMQQIKTYGEVDGINVSKVAGTKKSKSIFAEKFIIK